MTNNVGLIKTILSETFTDILFNGRIAGTDFFHFTMCKDNNKYTLSMHGADLEHADNEESFTNYFRESNIVSRLLDHPNEIINF